VLESSVADALVNKDIEVMNELLGEEKDDDYNLYKKINNSYYFKPNKTKQAFVENTRNNISKVDMVCSYIDKKEMQGNNPVVGSNPIGLYLKENLIGEILKYIFITDSNSVIIKKCNDDLLVANTQTLFAIKAYESDMGKSPVSLDDLVPEYLLSAPTNPYGGKELKYLPHNFNGGSVQNNDNKKIAEGCIVKQYEGPELISDISTDVRGGVVCHFYINTNLPVYNFTLHADVENNIINQIEITKGLEINVPVQVLDTEDMIEPPYRDADFFKAEDVNSDGYKDISLLIWWGVTGREGYMYWVFDPSKNIFVFDKERSDLY